MDDRDFKLTLSKTLERKYIKKHKGYDEDFIDVYTTIPNCGLYIEYTGILHVRNGTLLGHYYIFNFH